VWVGCCSKRCASWVSRPQAWGHDLASASCPVTHAKASPSLLRCAVLVRPPNALESIAVVMPGGEGAGGQ
jgi:hypothetical protein